MFNMVNIQCESIDTYTKDYLWSQGLHKQRNQKTQHLRQEKIVTGSLSIH